MSLLEVSDLHLKLGHTQILNGIDLRVNEGETVGIIGPNGSGKTTFFNCLSGFHQPWRGEIHFNKSDITTLRPSERALQGIGRVFQNSGVFREMSCSENIVTALESRQPLRKTFLPWGSTHSQNSDRALELLSEIGLGDKAKEKAGSLSGGQMRLLEIIRTLAFGASLFLLDEPTAGVSPKMKADVIALVRKLQDLGRTVLVIEHDINFIQSFCSRIVVLDSGKVVLDGAPEEVRNSELLHEIYFGSAAPS